MKMLFEAFVLASFGFLWLAPAAKLWGKVSLWQFFILSAVAVVFFDISGPLRNSYLKLFRRLMALEFVGFACYAFVMDSVHGTLPNTFEDFYLLGLFGMIAATTFALYARLPGKCIVLPRLLSFVLLFHSVLAILQFLSPGTFFRFPELLAWGNPNIAVRQFMGRVRGGFIDVHIFGGQTLGLIAFLLPFALARTQYCAVSVRKARLIPFAYFERVSILLGIVALIAAYLRAALVALIVVVFVHSILRGSGSRRWRALASTLGLILAIIWLGSQIGVFDAKTAGRLLALGPGIDDRRIYASMLALKGFEHAPFFGVGGRNVYSPVPIHGFLLRALSFYGIVGAFLYVLMLLHLLKRVRSISDEYWCFKIGLQLWLLSYVLYGIGHTASLWMGGLHGWMFVAIITAWVPLHRQQV